MKVKIAVAQFEIKNSSDQNIKRAQDFIKKASSKGANIIVFPESLVTESKTWTTQRYKEHFSLLAEKYHIDIVPGSIYENKGKFWLNCAYYFDSLGRIRVRYVKVNLWHSEAPKTKLGHEVPVFNTRYGRIGLVLCWDLIFPEIFREMVRKKVQIIICPSYWRFGDAGTGIKYDKNSEVKLVNALCTARAFENEIAFVYCNAAGRPYLKNGKAIKNDSLIGHSQISVPLKGCIKMLEHNREEMFITQIDTDLLKIAEKVYKIRRDIKIERKELRKLGLR